MSNITIIIPVHEFNDKVKGYLTKGLDSIKLQVGVSIPKIKVVFTSAAEEGGILTFLSEYSAASNIQIDSIKNEGKTDFCGQINLGVQNTTTDYFSILEYDDEYSVIYFKNIEKHIAAMPEVGMFLPFTVDVDDKTSTPAQMVNQTIWSKGYVGENGVLGFLNIKSLNDYSFYTIGGSVLKKSEFEAVGGLKSNIKLAFTYEFILRFLENANKIYSVPKFGYKHIINREGSLFHNYSVMMPKHERKFWFETAKKECHFFTDRVIDTKALKGTIVEA